ncbi:integrase core domain [Elysia marginata]|uniref:Integrase core domain n=1 Tax=Elysia marginata TaxID=1093978 RepID=A0AAV4FNK2_9GAST|nr:integrase core domain [Elysia marginata]
MDLIHKSHMGMVKYKQRGREVFFWPSVDAEIEQKVQNCQVCATVQKGQPQEPLNYKNFLRFPFSEIAANILGFQPQRFLITVDMYSTFIQVSKLNSLRSNCGD